MLHEMLTGNARWVNKSNRMTTPSRRVHDMAGKGEGWRWRTSPDHFADMRHVFLFECSVNATPSDRRDGLKRIAGRGAPRGTHPAWLLSGFLRRISRLHDALPALDPTPVPVSRFCGSSSQASTRISSVVIFTCSLKRAMASASEGKDEGTGCIFSLPHNVPYGDMEDVGGVGGLVLRYCGLW